MTHWGVLELFVLQLNSSWVVHLVEQFLFILLEFQEYYKEKCMSHTTTPGEQFVFIVQQYYNETVQFVRDTIIIVH